MSHQMSISQINLYAEYLQQEERSMGTVEKYLRDLRAFETYLNGRVVTKELVSAWKTWLLNSDYAPVTVNSMISAVNGFLQFVGWEECRVKFLRIQRRIFRDQSKDLTKEEYQRLLDAAEAKGQKRLALLMESICATGIRVSEVRHITVDAAKAGRVDISLKGKIRTILIPNKLSRKLLKYAKQQKIASGEIFLTKSGKSLSRRQIWGEMKAVCKTAGVDSSKVFPHNLRHLFATTFYRAYKDIVKLADVLGHSSIETTRIYLLTPGNEHAQQMERLGLIS